MERLLKPLLVAVMLVAITFLSMAQLAVIPTYYRTIKVNEFPVRITHTNSFETKDEAVKFHKIVLDMNGIDTTTTSVEWELDAPIFSSFLHFNDKRTAIVTYVNKNVFGTYTSCFMECENVTFDLFESDGMMLTQRKIK
jgi:hypothetical protein